MDNIKDTLKRFINDRFSFNDLSQVLSFFQKASDDQLKSELEEEWKETDNSTINSENLNLLLDRLHHKINLQEHELSTSKKFIKTFSRLASILILPALITIATLSYFNFKNTHGVDSWAEIHSNIGSRTRFQLPDGSTGWLNSGSSLKYRTDFIKKRGVEISGEAWFDVVHLDNSEFHVSTKYFDVQVVGTQFNITAYENDSTAEVILEKGKVIVHGINNKVTEMLPDQKLVYSKSSSEVNLIEIDSKAYSSWKDGYLIFKNVPMWEIAQRLERKYNTEIIIHGDSLRNSVFRATFQDENLEEICKLLSTVAPITYKIHDRGKLEDNTFEKSKIEMWLTK